MSKPADKMIISYQEDGEDKEREYIPISEAPKYCGIDFKEVGRILWMLKPYSRRVALDTLISHQQDLIKLKENK